jgi:hypothetical protein
MEKFNEIGFLSQELANWIGQTRTEFKVQFEASERINRLAMKMLFDLPAEEMTDAQAFANLCFGRALQSFQGAILLAQRGSLLDARTLVRSCAESAIALSALKADPTMPQRMSESYDHHRLRLAKAHLDRHDVIGMLTEAEVSEHRQIIEEINKKYGKKGPQPINWKSEAQGGGTIDLYDGVYRLTSGNGAHTTMASLERFLADSMEGNAPGFKFHPDKSDLGSTLFLACAAMLQALGVVKDWFALPAYQDELTACIENWGLMQI